MKEIVATLALMVFVIFTLWLAELAGQYSNLFTALIGSAIFGSLIYVIVKEMKK